MFKELGA
jgi:hypothetical protein